MTQQRNERGQFIRKPIETIELDAGKMLRELREQEAQAQLLAAIKRADDEFKQSMERIDKQDRFWKWVWSITLSAYAGYFIGQLLAIFL